MGGLLWAAVNFFDGVLGVLDGSVLHGDGEGGLAVEAAVEDLLVDPRGREPDPRALALVRVGIGPVHAISVAFGSFGEKSNSWGSAWRSFVKALV